MDKEKEIKAMTEIVVKTTGKTLFEKTLCNGEIRETVSARSVAFELLRLGYGNVEKAVKEFAEELKSRFIKHYPTAYKDAIYQFTDIEIDELINEIYGEKKK